MTLGRIVTSPHVISLAWAAWCWPTAFSYWHATPAQLDAVTRVVPADAVFWVWATAALLLTAGGVTTARRVGRIMRIAGLAIAAGMLIMWGGAYLWEASASGSRMWVSAKNYLFMAAIAMGTATVVARDAPALDTPAQEGRRCQKP